MRKRGLSYADGVTVAGMAAFHLGPKAEVEGVNYLNGHADCIKHWLVARQNVDRCRWLTGLPTAATVHRSSAIAARYRCIAERHFFAHCNTSGCDRRPIREQLPKGFPDDPTSAEGLSWLASGKPACFLCTVRGGGHVIPQRTYRFPRLLGRTTSALDAPREAIRFFEHNSFR